MTLLAETPATQPDDPRMTAEARDAIEEAVATFRRDVTSGAKRRKTHELIVEENVLAAVDDLKPSRRAAWAQALALATGGFSVSSLIQLVRGLVLTQTANWFDIVILAGSIFVTAGFAVAAERMARGGRRPRR